MSPVERRCTLPATPVSARDARRFVDAALEESFPPPVVDAARLLVSELVANAVLHTGTPIDLVVRCDARRARVEVHDGSPRLPVRKHYSTMSATGRGLVLVDRVASRWGADPTGVGKVVWFELDAGAGGGPTFDLLGAEAK